MAMIQSSCAAVRATERELKRPSGSYSKTPRNASLTCTRRDGGTRSIVRSEFENDIRRERQMDGIAKAKERGVRFGRKSLLLPDTVEEIRTLREAGTTVPEIIRRTGLSKASVYRALAVSAH
jgi:hypothetical protein